MAPRKITFPRDKVRQAHFAPSGHLVSLGGSEAASCLNSKMPLAESLLPHYHYGTNRGMVG